MVIMWSLLLSPEIIRFALCWLFIQHAKAAKEKSVTFLTPAEENLLCQYFMKKLLEFCNIFQPPVPRGALVGRHMHTTLACSLVNQLVLSFFIACVRTIGLVNGLAADMVTGGITPPGYGSCLLQEILPPHFSNGVPSKRHLVSSSKHSQFL